MCYLLTLMTPFPYINISKSIKTNWLAFENKWYRLEDIGTFVLAPLFILVIIVILYLKALNFSNQNDRAFGYFILPFIGLLCIYFIYRKITETKLFKLSTNLSKEQNSISKIERTVILRKHHWTVKYPQHIVAAMVATNCGPRANSNDILVIHTIWIYLFVGTFGFLSS